MRRHGLLLLAVLLAVMTEMHRTAQAIEAQCSACEAVAAELQRRLDAEVDRKHLDLRHRLDKDGRRYGRILDYKLSEIRAVELLDDLCSEMDDYTFVTGVTDVTNDGADAAEAAADSDASDRSSSDDGGGEAAAGGSEQKTQKRSGKNSKKRKGAAPQQQESSDDGSSSGGSGGFQGPAWVKHKGQGSTPVPRSKRPAQQEEDARRKQLKSYCGLLLEEQEEEVVEALTSDQFSAAGVAPVLCQQISAPCKHKTYAVPPALQLEQQQQEGGDREL